MAVRLQNLIFALSSSKQTDIATAASTFLRFRKLNAVIHTPTYGTETDKDEIGKGTEFITQVFPTAYDIGGSIEKYGSAEFVTWAWAYGLGNVSYGGGIYTLVPIDPTVTLETPYFSLVQQLNEGGSSAIDELYYGCAVESVNTVFNYGPGRQSVRTTVAFNGSGKNVNPSGATIPSTPQTEHYMLSQSMTATINGTDYVSGKTLLSGSIGWNNNRMLAQGFFPGSGTQNNAAIRGRIEIGNRVPTFTFRARLLHTSPEYGLLISQNQNNTTGTASLTLTYDSTHTVTWTFPQITYSAVERGEDNGIVTVDVTVAPQFNVSANAPMTMSAQCGITGIAS